MNHDAPRSAITPKVSARASPEPAAVKTKAPGGLWPFLRTLFIGSAGLAVLAVIATLAGSAWLTANQRAEAEKAQPWADPSFTTTAVTTGGMLARFMDNDGTLDNGHAYIKGIYGLWKSRHAETAEKMLARSDNIGIPPLWQIELKQDLTLTREKVDAAIMRDHQRAANRTSDNVDEYLKANGLNDK